MTLTTHDIAKAAIDAAFETLKAHGMDDQTSRLASDMQHELDAHQGVLKVVLLTQTGDAGAFAEKAKTMLEKKLGRTVHITEKADKTLLGGAILVYGDKRIDMSVRGALDDARSHLESSAT